MKKILSVLFLVIPFLGASQDKSLPHPPYGGMFSYNERDLLRTLFPPDIRDNTSSRIASFSYEGLFKINSETLLPEMCLLESFHLDSSRTQYTFQLKKGVFFHEDPCFPKNKGRELTAYDVEFCFINLCKQSPDNKGYEATFKGILKGADEFYEASADGKIPGHKIEGLKVLNKYTLQITLTKPYSLFLYNLSRPFCFIFPEEALKKYGAGFRIHPVGTGPFQIEKAIEGSLLIFKRNPNYHQLDTQGRRLPYLEVLKVEFIRDARQELLEFKNGKFSLINFPSATLLKEDGLDSLKYTVKKAPQMATRFIAINTQDSILRNKELRQALSFALDRKKILGKSDMNYSIPAYNGITPPLFQNYQSSALNGYELNLDSANYYLKKAGYKIGQAVPTIVFDLTTDEPDNLIIAKEIQMQLKKHLGISVELNILPLSQFLENAQSGKSEVFLAGWLAETPHPDDFLSFFYGSNVPLEKNKISFPNMCRYSNKQYDAYYEKALESKTQEEIAGNLLKAEKIMIEDAPAIFLWYYTKITVIHPSVKNLKFNPMNFHDLKEVYIIK